MASKRGGSQGSIIGTIIAAFLFISFLSYIDIFHMKPLPVPTSSTVSTPAAVVEQPKPSPVETSSSGEILIDNSGEAPLTVPSGIHQKELITMLNQLQEASPSTATYSRDYFKHWVDENNDGCTTRAEVLIIETTTETTRSGTCTIQTGSWFSVYDDKTVTDAGGIDIDHMVPLNEAWKSGADQWDAQKRQNYANDLNYPGSLIAVTAGSNRSKSDQDPALWMPPSVNYQCTYTATWVSVKWRWKLNVDQAEKAKLYKVLNNCTDEQIQLPTK